MNTPTLIPSNAIVFHRNQIRTTSLKVAEAFGKRHTHVLEKISKLECSPEFSSANFSADEIMVDIGKGAKRQSKVYEMTKDGFIFLVMGFTGKKAAQVKEAYINAFNAMAEELERQSRPLANVKMIMDAAKGLDADELSQVLEAAGAIKGRRLMPNTLTPDQQRHIQRMVANLAKLPGNSFQQVYRSIKDRFNVGSYKDVPADRYPALCKYLGGQPKNDPLAAFQLEQAPLEGDILEGNQLALGHELVANYPATGQHWRYQYRDLMNCGWKDNITSFLFELSKHKGKTIALKVDDVEGLKKEVASLQHMVESLHMHLERVRSNAMTLADETVWRG